MTFKKTHHMTCYPLCRTLDLGFYFFTSACAWFTCMLTYVGTHVCACGILRLMWSVFLDWPPPSSSNKGFSLSPETTHSVILTSLLAEETPCLCFSEFWDTSRESQSPRTYMISRDPNSGLYTCAC